MPLAGDRDESDEAAADNHIITVAYFDKINQSFHYITIIRAKNVLNAIQ